MSMKTYSLLVQSADQLPRKLRPRFYVKVTGCSADFKTEEVSSLKPHWNYESKICPTATQLTFQLLHRGLSNTKLVCQGTFSIQDLIQKSRTAHVVELSLVKPDNLNKKLGRLWIQLTENKEHSETHSTAALNQTPAAAASRAMPAAETQPETWRQDIGKRVKHTWQGLHQITKLIAPFVPQPFNTPFEIFNTISDVAVEYIGNKEALEDALVKLSGQLAEVEGVLLESDKYNIDITASSNKLADLLIKQAKEMHDIKSTAVAKKIYQQHEIAGKITECIDTLNQGTDDHYQRMTQAIARDVKKNVDFALASMLPSFAPRALFDADTGAAVSPRRECTPETRKELLDKLEKWAVDKSPNTSPIFWLSGMAGTGKSTVAYTLCKRLQGHKQFGGSFFCSRNDEQARARVSIIPTIVRQLIPENTAYAYAVRDLNLDQLTPASSRHVAELLIGPWMKSLKKHGGQQASQVIVIDALDEIEGIEGAHFIQDLIHQVATVKQEMQGLRFLLTSRPHPMIVEQCQHLENSNIYQLEQIPPETAQDDVHKFVTAEFGPLSEADLSFIVAQSGGIFIYAATVKRLLFPAGFTLSEKERKTRMQQIRTSDRLPKSGTVELPTDTLYKAILNEALPDIGTEVELSKHILYIVATSRRPQTVQELAPLVVDHLDNIDEEAVKHRVDALYAVLYISQRDKCVYSYHKSFDDFITDPQRYIHAEVATNYLAMRAADCFRILENSLHFNMCGLQSSYMLDEEDPGLASRVNEEISKELQYACRYWATALTLVQHTNSEMVDRLSKSLQQFSSLKILFWMEAMNLLKLDCRAALYNTQEWDAKVVGSCKIT
ncbi:hypothetical protein FB45DRAFT_308931 [Roridomyces roridus]|uniref:Nephrocystin 3-like N-terminal domain-containing protein n=1 Tax=Roridomyces roridus TaxID=1738132 RepID=A0AAD7B6Q7_9AGAR|nr:hypothetical protein FB45DRAFT_308931 [Roridomyces roridus]